MSSRKAKEGFEVLPLEPIKMELKRNGSNMVSLGELVINTGGSGSLPQTTGSTGTSSTVAPSTNVGASTTSAELQAQANVAKVNSPVEGSIQAAVAETMKSTIQSAAGSDEMQAMSGDSVTGSGLQSVQTPSAVPTTDPGITGSPAKFRCGPQFAGTSCEGVDRYCSDFGWCGGKATHGGQQSQYDGPPEPMLTDDDAGMQASEVAVAEGDFNWVTKVGYLPGGDDLETYSQRGERATCRKSCAENPECVGITYNDTGCWQKSVNKGVSGGAPWGTELKEFN